MIFPNSETESRVNLSALQGNDTQNLTVGILELLVQRENNHIRVWPGICPHEGAALTKKHICDGVAQCPWHGRRFTGALLKDDGKAWRFMSFDITKEKDELIVRLMIKKDNTITKHQENCLNVSAMEY